MSDKLQQAIVATRAGDTREAQQLLADELEENPDNEYAWFLLGNLVDSPEKRKAYLGKALAINPQNEKAKQQYGQVQRQIAATPSLDMDEVAEVELAAAEGASEVPDWLDQLDEDSTAEEESTADALETMDDIADKSAEAVEEKAVATAVSTSSKSDRERQLQRYNLMLIFLVLLIIVVGIILINSL